ncbi:FHA domain-containing protein [Agromyces sp. NPDC058484]|uniref:FHA domain-containing protein n=1 Tax=Agromyces sp. NPDC058484 TaxID=3346524 RepID=UPI0036682199
MATYLPDQAADWLAAVRGRVVLLAPASASAELTALWPRLTDGDPTSHVLDRLTAGGLAATPSFALVVRDIANGSVRVVVRGPLTVRTAGEDVSGMGVSTWTERVLETTSFEVTARSPAPDSAPDSGIPVVEAVVPALSVMSHGVESIARESPAVPPVPPVPPVAAAEQTMVPAEDTVAGPPTPAPPLPAIAEDGRLEHGGDHDGLTVASIDLRRLRAERAARVTEETPGLGLPSVVVDGRRSAPAAAASLRMPDGALEPLGPGVILGRAPSVSQLSGGRLPRLVTIGAGDPDISRSHVRIGVEGDTVVITDLHSRNGTHVVAPGKPPVKLRAGEPAPVLAGTVIDLGGGWTVEVVGD